MLVTRCCHYTVSHTMGRCSLRRLVVIIATLSVMATITFFIYSLSLDSPSFPGVKQGQMVKLRARQRQSEEGMTSLMEEPDSNTANKALLFQHAQESNDGGVHGIRNKNLDVKILNSNVVREKTPSKGKKSNLVEKMSWPDKRKGDKGRQVAKVHNSKHRSQRLDEFMGVTDPLVVPRIAEYCNQPVREVRGREGEAPPGYSLKSVYLIVRHGDRSPMGSFKNSPNPVLSCQHDSSKKFDIPNFDKFVSTMQYYQTRLHPGNTFPFHLYPRSQTCDSSELTGQGSLQHLLTGWHLHERYVQKWRLFSEPFSPSQVYVKSTGYSRTYQSAIALLYTFLPALNLTDLNIFRSDNLFFCSEKSFGHSCSCPVLRQYKKMSDGEAGAYDRNNTDLKRVRQYIANVYNIKRQELPWLWSMIDTLMAYACHKIPLPCNKNNDCIEPSYLAELWHQLDLHGAKLDELNSYQKYARLGIHPLLYEIKQHMVLTTKKKAKVKFVLYSGHDTTVSPLATALGIGHGRWPKYATRIAFELYSREEPKKHHFLRILINGEDVTAKVSFCKGQAKSGFCKLKYFVEFVQKENLSLFNGKTYPQACEPTTTN
ncbi:2-phosphoxylose phosphatase 1-like [Haliotis rubra]|uniref:2-phosphoxylose phosphatase 1-like n=1 Tax=Haliotis rubra TaxID=36100 RepID=UPI001EE4F458|nr:2-phosphoxylose phosphatase 1-like [Haliotis rubra]